MGRMVKKYVFRQKIDIFILIYFELSSRLVCMLLSCVKLFLAVILIPLWWNVIDKWIYYKYFPYSRIFDRGGHHDDVITGSSYQLRKYYLPISWSGDHNGSDKYWFACMWGGGGGTWTLPGPRIITNGHGATYTVCKTAWTYLHVQYYRLLLYNWLQNSIPHKTITMMYSNSAVSVPAQSDEGYDRILSRTQFRNSCSVLGFRVKYACSGHEASNIAV
jgi:hypothetical protein